MPHSTFLLIAFVIGAGLLSIAVDSVMHKSDRTGFAIGTIIQCLAAGGFMIFLESHVDFGHKINVVLMLFLALVALVGTLLVDNNNIRDQEGGAMSKWGTWWDGWKNDYFSNVLDKWETYLFMAVVVGAMFWFAVRPDPASSVQADAIHTPIKTAAAEPAAKIKKTHHAVTHTHHTATNSSATHHHHKPAEQSE